MTAAVALVSSLAALAISSGLLVLSRRASRARRELAESLHDRALALDRRCDVLQRQVDAGALRQRIDHLLQLVSLCERQERLDSEVARRLELFVLGLHDEARQAPGGG